MKKYKYGIIGRFAEGQNVYGGQTIKTRNFTDELEKHIGIGTVYRGDTRGWKKNPLKLIKKIRFALSNCEEIVMLPADRGILVIPRLLSLFRGKRQIKMQYVVIGGWLPEFLEKRKGLTRCLKKFDGIYVETKTMKNALEKQGFSNVVVFPNFKDIQVLNENELVYAKAEPYKLCTFSRVLKEKGIEDAANAVKSVNEKLGRTAYTLDIYGRVDPNYEEAFAAFSKDFPEYIRYMGAADGSKSTEIIKDYFALLFPTQYYTEGIPGTIIDAYSAGVPVISSRWESFLDVVDENVTGIGYKFADADALEELLFTLIENPNMLLKMKKDCLSKAKEFTPEAVFKIFCE